MSDQDKALQIYAEKALETLSASIDFPFDVTAVDWTEMRETILPQGELIKAEELVGRRFTLFRAKQFESSYGNEGGYAYWCVGGFDDGTVFNTVLGGKVVKEVIDAWIKLNIALKNALQAGDENAQRYLLNCHAGKPLSLTLDRKQTGRGKPYYAVVD